MSQRKSPTDGATQISLFASKEAPASFRKAVQVLHSLPKAPLTLLQRKVANAWLKNALDNDPHTDGFWQMSVQELSLSTGFDSKNGKYLKDCADALMSIVFEWDVMAPQAKRVDWKKSVLFPEVEARAGLIRYQLSSEMRRVLLNPDIYAVIDMNVVRRFRRASSLAIWEYCVRYEKLGQTAEVEWGKFRDMVLGESADADTYKEYKYFKSKVLKPGVAEINAESNHLIELVETKQGKRVKALRFTVAKKDTQAVGDGDQDARNVELIGELVRLGIMQSEARKLCATNTFEDVKGALEYAKRRISNKTLARIENPGAYFRDALSKKYKVHDDKAGAGTAGASPAAAMDIKAEFALHQQAEARSYFKELDTSDQTALVDRYNEQQQASALKVKKKASLATEAAFFRWLARETWGEPSPDVLLAFAQQLLAGRARGR